MHKVKVAFVWIMIIICFPIFLIEAVITVTVDYCREAFKEYLEFWMKSVEKVNKD